MRTILYLLSFVIVFCCSDIVYAKDITQEDVKNSIKINEFTMSGASQDISANISLWVGITKETSSVSLSEGWPIVLGDKIPSQPIAVIEVLSLINHDEIRCVCPRPFMEGSEIYEMEQWMNSAINSLSSFTMNDPKKDKIRIECLERIKKSLAGKDSWFKAVK